MCPIDLYLYTSYDQSWFSTFVSTSESGSRLVYLYARSWFDLYFYVRFSGNVRLVSADYTIKHTLPQLICKVKDFSP